MSQHDGGEVDSFAYRHPVLFAARVALICTAIMVVAKSVGAWLDDDSVSVGGGRPLRPRELQPGLRQATGFFVVAKRGGYLKR